MSTAPRLSSSLPGGKRLSVLVGGEPRAELRSVEVTWRVTRSAMGELAPPGRSRLLRLMISIEGLVDSARAAVRIEDPESGQHAEPARSGGVRAEVIPDIRGEVHIEAPGWLHATIAPDEAHGSWRLVYARTPMLAQIGIPGGRAEPVGVRAD